MPIPDQIIASPFLRARGTADIARVIIQEVTGQFVEIHYDHMLGEYLDQQRNLDLEESVLEYQDTMDRCVKVP